MTRNSYTDRITKVIRQQRNKYSDSVVLLTLFCIFINYNNNHYILNKYSNLYSYEYTQGNETQTEIWSAGKYYNNFITIYYY